MKQFVLFTALMAACLLAQAQQQVRFGVKAGLNLSSLGEYELLLEGQEDAELENKPGFHAGIVAQIPLANQLGIETGVFYTQLGGRERERDWDEQYKVTANSAYLQVPVSLFYEFQLPMQISIYPSLGVYGSYGLGGDIKAEGQVGGTDITRNQQYFGDFANRFDFGGTAGLHVGLGHFLIGAGYDRGFTRVNSERVPYGDNAFNSNIRFSVGFLF